MKPTRIGKGWFGILRMAAVVWVTAGMLLFAFEQPVFAAQPIKVGVLTFLSGKLKPIGDEIVTGIQTAVKMQGPVLGRPIELVLEDSLVNAQVAVTKGT